jgi:hypothetical protein
VNNLHTFKIEKKGQRKILAKDMNLPFATNLERFTVK